MIEKLINITNKSARIACGLMSGTSVDGIDAALVEIRGSGTETEVRLLHFFTLPFTPDEKHEILKICSPETSSVDAICRLNVSLGEKMAKAAHIVIHQGGLKTRDIDFISSHGQTIYHMPQAHATMQIGELAVIAERTGCLTVGDFRPSDMAAGGQGAPLVPYSDYLLFRSKEKGRVLLNIGGISNVTVIKPNARPDEVYAFDTGPGNMLIDAVVRIGTDGARAFDEGGCLAARGRVKMEWLQKILQQDGFIIAPPPKSTGREHYSNTMAMRLWNDGRQLGLSLEDITAVLTEYTAQSILLNFEKFIDPAYDISEVLVSGGGVHNKTLMRILDMKLKQEVLPMEALAFSSDAKEAIAFAILGNEFLFGNTNNLLSATGAKRNVVMGKIVFPGIE
jgi:anhydro-N-acetylmuramic acid kinase